MEMRPRPLAPPAAAFAALAMLFPPGRHHIPPLFPRLPSDPIVLSSVHLSPLSLLLMFLCCLLLPYFYITFALLPFMAFRTVPVLCPSHCLLSVLFGTLPLPFTSDVLLLPHTALSGQISQGNQQRQTKISDFIILVKFPLQFLP